MAFGSNSPGSRGLRSKRIALHRQPKKREKGAVKADINVTPLVDVVLVLLIIFMVVTPMLVRGVAVDLPKVANPDKKSDDGKDIIVSLTMGGEIYINTDRVKKEQLPDKIQEEKRRHPDKIIYLKADNRCKYGDAREVMELMHKVGIEDIQLGTEEPKKGS